MQIIIPMAGLGKRLGPLTHRKPKALIRLAHQRLLDHVLGSFAQLESRYDLEYIFILGYMGEQIRQHMATAHPGKKVAYCVQEQLLGQSHAIYLAREVIRGPVLLTYCDTINEIDYSRLAFDNLEGLASVKEIDDPRRHGVAILGQDGLVTRLVEKPETVEHRLALSGVYYFSEGTDLIEAIETQMERGTTLGKEYYLADAINIMLERGMQIRTANVIRWLDAGTPEAVIETNAALLRTRAEPEYPSDQRTSSLLRYPCFIHETAGVQNSIIGPNVSIGQNCIISGSILENTIVDDGSQVVDARLQDSLIGMHSLVTGRSSSIIVADHDRVEIGGETA